MIVYRIFAVIWVVACCFGIFNFIRRASRWQNFLPRGVAESKSAIVLFLVTLSTLVVLDLTGIAASFLLFIGMAWALWLIGLGAVVHLMAIGCKIVSKQPLGIREFCFLGISIIALVLLFGWKLNIFHF